MRASEDGTAASLMDVTPNRALSHSFNACDQAQEYFLPLCRLITCLLHLNIINQTVRKQSLRQFPVRQHDLFKWPGSNFNNIINKLSSLEIHVFHQPGAERRTRGAKCEGVSVCVEF